MFSLRTLSRGESVRIWNILEKLGRCYKTAYSEVNIEIEALKLAIRFCCFHCNGFYDPERMTRLTRKDYYLEAQQIIALRKPRFNGFSLSKLIKDETLAYLLKSQEESLKD